MAARTPAPLRLAAAGVIGLILVAAVLGGLQRLGVAPAPALTANAALSHGALMIGAWLGTVIALERAVALKTALARSAPPLAAAGGLALLAGTDVTGAALLCAAATAFALAHVELLRRQRVPHVFVLALAALCWWGGNAAFAFAAPTAATPVLAAWFAFLVLTIAAERLELTRLKRRHVAAQPVFFAIVAALVAGVSAGFVWPAVGGMLFSAALVTLAIWLATQDVALVTIHQRGLPRYMAVALLAGYAWLAAGGVAWGATALGQAAARDTALHALGLGFVLSMVMAHAPVILPAVAGVRLAFGSWFYAPLALLHGSLLLRLAWAPAPGATLNALALLLFALTVIGSALAWRRRR
jgi:hypothetical protein